jgi:DNA topoisomerase-1
MFLIICEKQNAAHRIATILSKGKAKRTVTNNVPFYDFIDGEKNKITVVGLKGHVINLDFPKEYNRWDYVDPKVLIQTTPIKKIQDFKIVNFLKNISKNVDRVLIATDYDREGELIGVEGLELVKKNNPEIAIKRARFSALTTPEVLNAFNNLSEVDYNLSSAANSRQIIDLKWGAVLTRFISLASKQTGKDFLSVGRVQSPTLALIVDRDKEISEFKSKPYWQLMAFLEKEKKFEALHETDRFWDHDEAKRAFDQASKANEGKVVDVQTKEEVEIPPAPFNTTSFLRAATALRLSAAKVMAIAEELYTNGLISYPRTDNTVYPKTLSLKRLLEMFKGSTFNDEATEILAQDRIYPTRGKVTATDHPPIHPVGVAKQSELQPSHWKVYELVVRRFFATVAKRAEAISTKVEIDINKELFISKGYKYIEKGWHKYYPYFDLKEKFLPKLNEGDMVQVIKIDLAAKETKPPKRFSQGALIQEMDKLGLGTKSTRHDIIQKLYSRGYIHNSTPEPTLMGKAVIFSLEKFANTITKPDMTSILEKDMDEIAKGNKKMTEVVEESEQMLEEIFTVLEQNRAQIGKSIQEALRTQNTIGKCKECGADLVILTSRRGKRFIGCSRYPECKNSYALPQYGKIISKGLVCDLCGAPEVSVINSKKKPWNICVNITCDKNKGKVFNNNRTAKKY